MAEDNRWRLVEDIVEGLAHGETANSFDAFSIVRRDDGTVLEIDLGNPTLVYLVTVSAVARVE